MINHLNVNSFKICYHLSEEEFCAAIPSKQELYHPTSILA